MLPYTVLGIIILFVIFLFWRNRIPEPKINSEQKDEKWFSGLSGITRYRHLMAAVVAQFLYVGAQVGVGSFFVKFCATTHAMNEKSAGYLLGSVAMVGFMAGRFAGTFLMKLFSPVRLLLVFSMVCVMLLAIAVNTSGAISVYALTAVPFFMSIMFPTIFDLGIKDTGEHARLGASLIIMAIAGGAVIPFIMGRISDSAGSIQPAYYVPLVCFAGVALFALTYKKSYQSSFKKIV
jgi:FHS family L-fucose permease-like MFS transporter